MIGNLYEIIITNQTPGTREEARIFTCEQYERHKQNKNNLCRSCCSQLIFPFVSVLNLLYGQSYFNHRRVERHR